MRSFKLAIPVLPLGITSPTKSLKILMDRLLRFKQVNTSKERDCCRNRQLGPTSRTQVQNDDQKERNWQNYHHPPHLYVATGAPISVEKPLLSLKYGLNSEATEYGWENR